MAYSNDDVIDLNSTELPDGDYLCRLEVGELEKIGTKGSQGFRVKASVVEPDYKGSIVEDVLWLTPNRKTLNRLARILKHIANNENSHLTPPQIQEALDGQLARLTVKIDEESTRDDRVKVTFDGYQAPTPQELAAYSNGHGKKKDDDEDIPF